MPIRKPTATPAKPFAKPIKERATPRISVNKLGEYIGCNNPSRRKTIIQDAKCPPKFIVARYSAAREYIKKYYLEDFDYEVLEEAIDFLKGKTAKSKWHESDIACSIDALEAIEDCEVPDLTDLEIAALDDSETININGVEISVNPDLVIRGKYKGKDCVGAIKFHLSKNKGVDGEAGKIIATLLKHYTEEHLVEGKETVVLDFCMSIDVFSNTIETAPASFKRRMSYIEDACEEIALRWDKIECRSKVDFEE